VAKELRRFKRESSRVRMSRVTTARAVVAPVDEQFPGRNAGRSWKRFIWPTVAGALALLLIVASWMLWRSGNTQNIVARLAVPLPKDDLLNISVYTAVAISPDGTRLVYRSNDQLRLRNINSYLSTPIAGTEYASSPFFSPDNRWIGFFSGGKLKKVLVSGGAPIVLADAPDNRGGSWGKDGTIVFSSATNVGISRVSDAGGTVEILTVPDSTKKERTHRWPQWLPDGKIVLFTVGSLENPDYYDDATIQAVNIESKKQSVILQGASLARYLPNGFLVYARAGVLLAVPFDANRLEIKGTAFPAIENVSGDASTAASNFAYADNGTLAYIPGETSRTNLTLALVDHSGNANRLAAPPQAYIEPRMSPDGHRVAVVVNAERGFDLWVHDITRNTLSRLTFSGTNRTPAWSPDGKRIAYFSIVEGKASVMIKQADGTGNAEEVSTGLGRTYVDSWSRDGSYLFLDRTTNAGQSDIYVVPLKGDRKPWPFLATKFDEYQGTLSPNGKWVAYISNESGTYQVYILPFPKGEGKWQVSTEEGYEPHWSRDGKSLFYAMPSKQAIMVASIDGSTSIVIGKPRVAFTGYHALNSDSGISYDITPDEQHFLTPKGKEGDDSFTRIHVILNWFDDLQRLMSSSK
jgi:eukaryotic-like serine/threonine-protein kinase